MNNHQRAKQDSLKRFLTASNNSEAKLTETLVPGFPAEKDKLVVTEKKIDVAGTMQVKDTTGAVTDNQDAQKLMARLAVKFGLRGAVKARNAGKHQLAEQLNHHVNYILKAPKGVAVQRATAIAQALTDNLSICNNVTVADVTSITDAITAFQLIETEPVSLIEVKKAQGTELLPDLLKEADEIIENMYNLVYSYYFETDPALVNEFYLAMQLIDTGIHHTVLQVNCNEANSTGNTPGLALQKVKVNIVEVERVALTDITGFCRIVKFKPGTYHVEFSLDGYASQTHIIKFSRGRTVDIKIEMLKDE